MRIILTFILLSSSLFAENWVETQLRLSQQRANTLNIAGGNNNTAFPNGGGGLNLGNQLFASQNSQVSQLIGSLQALGGGGGLGGLGGFNNGGLPSKLQNILSILQIASTALNLIQTMFGGQQVAAQNGNGFLAGQGNPLNIGGATGNTQGQYFKPGSTISGDLRFNTDGPGTTDNKFHQSQTASTMDGGYFPNMTQHGAVAVAGSGAKIGDLIVVQQNGQSRIVPVSDTTFQTNSVNGKNYGTDIVEVSKHTYTSLGSSSGPATMTNTGVNVASGRNFSSATMARVEEVNQSLARTGGRPTDADARYIQTGVR